MIHEIEDSHIWIENAIPWETGERGRDNLNWTSDIVLVSISDFRFNYLLLKQIKKPLSNQSYKPNHKTSLHFSSRANSFWILLEILFIRDAVIFTVSWRILQTQNWSASFCSLQFDILTCRFIRFNLICYLSRVHSQCSVVCHCHCQLSYAYMFWTFLTWASESVVSVNANVCLIWWMI